MGYRAIGSFFVAMAISVFLYVWIWFGVVGGIADIIDVIKSSATEEFKILIGLIRMIFGFFGGLLAAMPINALGRFIFNKSVD